MPRATSNGIELEYETFGDPGADPLLLVMGLGAQMLLWDEEFCEMLADRGHWVVRFDNRDVGLSTKLHDAPSPDIAALLAEVLGGETPEVPYLLSDMAADAAGLLDALEIEAAHVVGASMGGMIAQTLAIEHAPRVRSLTSIMSTTGRRDLPPARPDAMARLLLTPPAEREANIEHSVETSRVIGSPGFSFDEQRVRRRQARCFDRAYYPAGTARQLAAILASPPRHETLREVACPTLVIHGSEDPLVPVEGGLDTHESTPGSELLLIEGMGHDLPAPVWPRIADAISKRVARS